jgi:hypothetical protein
MIQPKGIMKNSQTFANFGITFNSVRLIIHVWKKCRNLRSG